MDKGTSNSDGTYNVNAHVTGTGDLTVNAGGDWNLKGAVASANSVTANIAGNLNIESQVDTQNVDIDHKTISGSFGGGGASFDYTSQTANGESSTVSEQSGIHTGKGGFDLKVDGNTGLIAGVITSTAPEDKNKLETGTLSWSDIETGSQWETKTSGFGGTIGTGASGAAGSGPLIKPTLKDGDKDSGSAKSAISSGQITITNPEGQNQDLAALNHDTTNTNDEIKALPDLQAKLDEQLKTQQEWTQAAANMAEGVKELSNKLFKDTNNPMWDEGGVARAALHAIAGGLLGGVNGVDGAIKAAIGAGVSTLIAPYINDIVKDAVKQSGLTGEDAKRMPDALTSSIVLGLLAGAGSSSAAGYASNEIKYNYLKEDQLKELDKYFECETRTKECSPDEMRKLEKRFMELQQISIAQTLEMQATCCAGPSEACSQMIADAKKYLNWYYAPKGSEEFRNTDNNFDITKIGRFAVPLDRLLVDAYSQGHYGNDALNEVNKYIIQYESSIGAVGDAVGVVLGIAGCIGTEGVGCAIVGGTLASLSANRLIQNGTQIVTGKEELSLIEQDLMKAGLSQANASALLNGVELGTAVVAINQAGLIYVTSLKNGNILAVAQSSSAPMKSSEANLGLLKPQVSRYYADKVNQASVAKTQNTVIDRSVVDINADIAAIRAGQAQKSGENYIINGRTYKLHDNTLYPVSGPGFYSLDHGAYKALGVYNSFGNTPEANVILQRMNMSTQAKNDALSVWKALQK